MSDQGRITSQNFPISPILQTQDGFSASFGQQDTYFKAPNILPDDIMSQTEGLYVNGFEALDTSGITIKKTGQIDETPTRVAHLVQIG